MIEMINKEDTDTGPQFDGTPPTAPTRASNSGKDRRILNQPRLTSSPS